MAKLVPVVGGGGIAFTVVTAWAVLLDGVRSVSLPATVAVLVIWPACAGVTMMEIVAVVAVGTLPILQVTVPPTTLQAPCVDVAETKVTLTGRVSVRVTPVAGLEGPLLVTISV